MPTIEPRVTFTPTPNAGPLLRELAELTGKTPARLVREILDEMAPQLPSMIEALRMVKTRPEKAAAALHQMAARAHAEISQQTLDLNKSLRKRPGRKPRGEAAKPG